jgi:hypothetical protein
MQDEKNRAGAESCERSSHGEAAGNARWSVSRKKEAVLRLLRGESIDTLSRELGVEIYRLEEWQRKALNGIDSALKVRQGDPMAAELDAAMRRIGEISMENELLREKARRAHPLAVRRSKK